ncbi:hypothetical protein BG452_13520 [Streptomyces sp. CBMA123]|nr:hypothetical protein [Streptomyces sp. CBMA123]
MSQATVPAEGLDELDARAGDPGQDLLSTELLPQARVALRHCHLMGDGVQHVVLGIARLHSPLQAA